MEKLLPYFIDMEQDVYRSKNPDKAYSFWLREAWTVDSCETANMLFTEMVRCPVCMVMAVRDEEGVYIPHRDEEDLFS